MVKYLILFYVFLYLSHIILGPYWYRFYLANKPIRYKSKNLNEIINKSLYITYLSLIYTIYFFCYPSSESFILAFTITLLSLILYIIIYKDGKYFTESVIDHSLLVLPFIYYYYFFNINILNYNVTNQTYLTLILAIIYPHIYKKIYV